VNRDKLVRLLQDVQDGNASVEEAVEALRDLPYEDLGFARIDHHRPIRTGAAEVVFGPGKTADQLAQILQRLAEKNGRSLATKVVPPVATEVLAMLPGAVHLSDCGILRLGELPEPRPDWRVAVVCAGTADLPVAREAEETARFLACSVETHFDIGVAGLHRTLAVRDKLAGARAVIVVAGMDGVLPSVIGGLLAGPVIAVPTSAGYGASFQGLGPLLTMLNCCAPGVAVVNIDNGFGAAYLAYQIAARGETG
jgi:NCAIR mutase (PurE)-related protein